MDPKGVQRVQDTWRNELVAEEVAVEGRCPVSIVVAVEVAADQTMIHIDMGNHMTDKNCSETVIAELVVVEHFDKAMDAVAVVEYHMMSHHRKIEGYSANTVAEVEKLFYPLCS